MPRRRPPPDGRCPASDATTASSPQILSPVTGAAYQIRAARLDDADPLSLVATADGSVRTLYWFVDAGYVGAASPSELLAWRPARAGEFSVSVVDDRGASDSRTVRVELVP
jgi:penicillin-binding protein 1C